MAGIPADPPRVERRLVTILAADVAGYSRLTGADEEGTYACLKAHRRELIDPKITEYHGRIVNVTGDGMLVEFASPVEAVRCAVDFQRGMVDRNAGTPADKRIMFRVGINLGDIIVEEKDVYGDGVNIAARLEGLAEPGGLCISRTVRDQVRDRLPYLFEDRGEQLVKNIARPVRVFALSAAAVASLQPDERATAGEMAARAPPVATNAAPTRLSIMVLPFASLSNDPEQEYLADGITNDLTTDLSRISGSFVIARNTAFTYTGKVTDVRRIGRELGIRYVLEGSLRRTAALVRINAQLVDVETGAQLWSERFDRDRADLAAMQDEIIGRIATTLRYELIDLESSRSLRERQTNPDAVDLTMRGWSTYYRQESREARGEARDLFEQAVRIDDRLATAWAGLALTHAEFVSDRWSADLAEELRLAEVAATRALALDPKSAEAHYAWARTLREQQRFDLAAAEFERAIALNRNLADAHANLGLVKILLGRAIEGFAPIDEALRLSPRDPNLSAWLMWIGLAHSMLGEDERVVSVLEKSVSARPNWGQPYFILAGAYGLTGRDVEARAALADYNRLRPNMTIKKLRAEPYSNVPAYLVWRERLFEGLRKAGMPDE